MNNLGGQPLPSTGANTPQAKPCRSRPGSLGAPLRGEGGPRPSGRPSCPAGSEGKAHRAFQLGNSPRVPNKSEKLVYCRVFSVRLVTGIFIPPPPQKGGCARPGPPGRWLRRSRAKTPVITPVWGWRGSFALRGLRGPRRGLITRKGVNDSRISLESPASSPLRRPQGTFPR